MSRVLALDVGRRRTGVAVSDPTGTAVRPLQTIKHHTLRELLSTVLRIVNELNVEEVVVGLPERTDGEPLGEMKTYVERLITMLEGNHITVRRFPEWFTTKEARRLLERSKRRRKENIDAKAAQIILTSYLHSRKNR